MSANGKTTFVPYMCDHGYVVAAALEAHGMAAEALPPPDEESLAIGLRLCRGRECLPCFLSTGDLIRRAQQPDFEPAEAILLLPSATGLCRFGQYRALQRMILDQHGLAAVEIISPSASNAYFGLGEHPTALRRLMWQGAVGVDLLQKLLHAYRPYELNPGATDAAYRESLNDVVNAVRDGGGKRTVAAIKRAASAFEMLAIDRNERRPRVGLIGEIYLRFNEFSNQHIVRTIEAAGGEVVVATMMEWLYFTNWVYAGVSRGLGNYGNLLTALVSDVYQKYEERRLARLVERLVPDAAETPIGRLMDHLRPYYEPVLGLETEAGLSLGKAVEFARSGVCGIVNVMPFGCMPGIVVAGMAARFRSDLNNIPWLDISFDAQGSTNIQTRLEAFIYQARQYQRSTPG